MPHFWAKYFADNNPMLLGSKLVKLWMVYLLAGAEACDSYQRVVRNGTRPRSQTAVARLPAPADLAPPDAGRALPDGVVSLAEERRHRTA